MKSLTDDATVRGLQQTLGELSTRAAVVASNLANVDTPGFRAQRATFIDVLEGIAPLEMKRTGVKHLDSSAVAPSRMNLVEAPVLRVRLDGNSVDVDQEMTALSRFQGMYTATAQMIRKRFAMMRYAANDGRN